jgi:UDP-N-acetyl-D-glucosamine dehydrogenase
LSTRIGVVGQGYVGLPLAIAASKSGFEVIGIDSDEKKVAAIISGKSVVEDISDIEVLTELENKKYIVSTDYNELSTASIILICVPTPLSEDRNPDLAQFTSAVESVSKVMAKNSLIIIESTVEPGTTRNLVVPILEKGSGMNIKEFELAFSPERVDPSNKIWTIKNTPKIVSGLTAESMTRASNFYRQIVDQVVECESLEIAETAKLLENSFRLVNISFINEMGFFCQKLGIDVNDVIKAAATKPYGFMPFYPSIGVGGHCIPVDPLYLANKALEVGVPTRFIDLADQINQELPGYFVGRAEEKLGELMGKKVLVVGVAYKPNVADVRETPVKALILGLKNKGATVTWHDDLVKEWKGEKSVELSSDYNLAILATPHDYLDLTKLGNVPILNTRGSI